ncbi:hypothetical protein GT039_36855 [Streptomyces sp. SID2955]|nr:hypothetical protein [Streptomyces sp. SID2955]
MEDLSGARLHDLAYPDIKGLVGDPEAAEAEDLDYKRAHYGPDDKGREELAKDVAALANHRGGVLVLGMAEAKGVPSRVFDVDLDDHHLRRIRRWSRTTPHHPSRTSRSAFPFPMLRTLASFSWPFRGARRLPML